MQQNHSETLVSSENKGKGENCDKKGGSRDFVASRNSMYLGTFCASFGVCIWLGIRVSFVKTIQPWEGQCEAAVAD